MLDNVNCLRVLLAAWIAAAWLATATTMTHAAMRDSDLDAALTTLAAAEASGDAQNAAAAAWEVAAGASAEKLIDMLAGMDEATPLGMNWIRSAVEAIADRKLGEGNSLPVEAIQEFVRDREHHPKARRLAFEVLSRADATAAQSMIDGFIDDPSVELRREAVARLIEKANDDKSLDQAQKSALYQDALKAARDVDQIESLAKVLGELGEKFDLPRHFGFITDWRVIGPFDNTGGVGFGEVYPPEEGMDFDAEFEGKSGKVRWQEHTTGDPYGMVDLNKALGKAMGATAYAHADFQSSAARDAEIRVGCICGVKVWLNGELVDSREVYHSGSSVDQYIAKVRLKRGANAILVKICQNEQTEPWAQDWSFQLRVCDAAGTAVLSQDRLAALLFQNN